MINLKIPNRVMLAIVTALTIATLLNPVWR
jgi:hypothetical protein